MLLPEIDWNRKFYFFYQLFVSPAKNGHICEVECVDSFGPGTVVVVVVPVVLLTMSVVRMVQAFGGVSAIGPVPRGARC